MNLNGVEYYYIRNAQNDIIGLFDKTGTQVVSYVYDSWGKLIAIDGSLKDTVGHKNPYRYRGYRYDDETEIYYLQSRYYNPEWGRFINADSIIGETGELLSHNMFTYCNNDQINMEDPDGDIAWWVGAAIGGALFDSAVYLFQHRNGGSSWNGLGKAAATGALTGVAFAGAGKFVAKGARAVVSSRKAKAIAKAACFTEDTPILTKDGYKPIKEIEIGDEVYSENPETGEKGLKKVNKVFVNETDKLIHLYVDGEEIKTTSDHPFWVVGEGWVGAEDLRVGDKVLLYSGNIAEISKISIEQLDHIIKVYNFEVEDWHTYFVSNNNILVHNACSFNIGSWAKGSFETAKKSALKHFEKHGAEVGAKNVEQYIRKAEAFKLNLRGATKSRVNGATQGVIRYKKAGKYIDLAPDGSIISFGKQ
ncbi:polymorphic toxin-type HINT domain-containing protein [Clostridium sp. JNZ J1-5]